MNHWAGRAKFQVLFHCQFALHRFAFGDWILHCIKRPRAYAPPMAAKVISHYRIVGHLGSSGMVKPQNSELRYQTIFEWLVEYLKKE